MARKTHTTKGTHHHETALEKLERVRTQRLLHDAYFEGLRQLRIT